MSAEGLIKNNPKIILFDGVCCLCAAWVDFVVQRNTAQDIQFASVQSAQGQALLRWCQLPTDEFDTMVYIEHGQAYFRSTAFLRVVKHLNKGWPLLSIGRFCPSMLRDWLYDRIALNRYRLFGKREVCLLPTPALKARFL